MQKPRRPVEWLIWGMLALVVLGIAIAYANQRSGSQFMNLRHVPDFTLTNQLNAPVSRSTLQGEVWLANIIFTRCPGPCVRMTKQFAEIQGALPGNSPVKLVSLTSDPAYDTPAVLKEYGERFKADPTKWHFLTGSKKEVYQLATEGLLLAVQEKKPEERESADDLFIHSTLIMLVDKRGDVRSFYESTEAGVNERIVSDVKKLLRQN